MSVGSIISRKVATVLQTKMVHRGAGFEAASIGTHNFTEKMNPFLNIDHFNMDVRVSRPFFGPHPHAGFCPVTFLLEDSVGMIKNRDTIDQTPKFIAPGDIFFSTAGSGLMHEEIPSEVGKNTHGLQIFINLASKNKEVAPRHDHLASADIPVVQDPSGATVRVVIGRHNDTESALKPLTPVTLLDVKVPKGVSFQHRPPKGWNSFLLVMKGSGKAGPDGSDAPALSAVGFEVDGDSVDFTSSEDSRIIIAAGEPIHEPVVFGGPFVANSREQLQKFQLAYMSGEMGNLKKSF